MEKVIILIDINKSYFKRFLQDLISGNPVLSTVDDKKVANVFDANSPELLEVTSKLNVLDVEYSIINVL